MNERPVDGAAGDARPPEAGQGYSGSTAGYLCDPVPGEIGMRDRPLQPEAQGERRVEVGS